MVWGREFDWQKERQATSLFGHKYDLQLVSIICSLISCTNKLLRNCKPQNSNIDFFRDKSLVKYVPCYMNFMASANH